MNCDLEHVINMLHFCDDGNSDNLHLFDCSQMQGTLIDCNVTCALD